MHESSWLRETSAAFRLVIATSWLAPESWQKNQETAIREAIGAGPDWTEYLSLVVSRHRTPALSWAALCRVPGIAVPEPVMQELKKRSDACRIQAVKHCLLLAEVLKGLNRAGIPVVLYKGPILSLEIYGDVGLRQSRDLDLEVAQEDLAKAQACVEDMGWCLDSTLFPMTPRQRESFLRNEHDIHFDHPHSGCVLEIHWRNDWDTPELTSARWARSTPSVWQECFFQAMNPVDMVLFLCSHGGDHHWRRAKWLGDLARVRAAGQMDWAEALGEARRTGQERVLLAGLRLLSLLYGLPLPDWPGDPWTNLPSDLIEIPLLALKSPEERRVHTSLAELSERLRVSRYERLLRPQMSWRDSLSKLLYCRDDFREVRLPDGLFWAYVPLRPILRACRWARQSGRRIRERW
jgi:hypothetical protein